MVLLIPAGLTHISVVSCSWVCGSADLGWAFTMSYPSSQYFNGSLLPVQEFSNLFGFETTLCFLILMRTSKIFHYVGYINPNLTCSKIKNIYLFV